MADQHTLESELRALEGRGYKAYKSLGSRYSFAGWTLRFDHVQGDPFADPSRLSALIPASSIALPAAALHSTDARRAAADFLNRSFLAALHAHASARGSGKSGVLTILSPGQEVLRRTSMTVSEDGSVEARFRAGLPARGRTILGHEAAELIVNALPAAVGDSLLRDGVDLDALQVHVQTVENAVSIREQLTQRRLVAFVADGAVLPRRSGIDDRPMDREAAIPFVSPEELRVELKTPHAGIVAGMGIPEGVTLLAGGGFHGKSTLLRAVQRGVYDHIPGDGREYVLTRPDAVKVRAEDGRSIHGTDISAFIGRLPSHDETDSFHTENASGSTSQAAAIAEALEMGSGCLLIDEDTSATNFLIRDARVQALIQSGDEPITPLMDRLPDIRDQGVSMVLVIGGSGDFFDVADTVIAMKSYRPVEVTEEAKRIARDVPTRRQREGGGWSSPNPRHPSSGEIRPRRGRHEVHARAYDAHRLSFGDSEIDLGALEQLVEPAQTLAIARVLAWARDECVDGERTLRESVRCMEAELEANGLEGIDPRRMGEYAEFRRFELAGVLNRLRGIAPED